MKLIILLLTCLSISLTACGTSTVSDTTATESNVAVVEAEKETEVQEEAEEEMSSVVAEEVPPTIDYEKFNYTVKSFEEMFNINQPSISLFDTSVTLGVTTLWDINNKGGFDSKYLKYVESDMIAPYHGYEYTMIDNNASINITLYGYNLTGYHMSVGSIPIYGIEVSMPNTDSYIFDTSIDETMSLSSDDFTFNANTSFLDLYEVCIQLTPHISLAKTYADNRYSVYIPTDYDSDGEQSKYEFTVEGKSYNLKDMQYSHMSTMETYPKLILVYGGEEDVRSYEYDKSCEIINDDNAIISLEFPEIGLTADMFDIYRISPCSVHFIIKDDNACEFKYSEFTSSELKAGSEYEFDDEDISVTVSYVDRIEGVLDFNGLIDEAKSNAKFVIGSGN